LVQNIEVMFDVFISTTTPLGNFVDKLAQRWFPFGFEDLVLNLP